MILNINKMNADLKWEARKFMVSLVVDAAALLGAGAALGNYLASRQQPTQQVMFPPGTVITIPAAKP